MNATITRGRPPPTLTIRRWWWRHPEAPLFGVSAAAWTVLVVDHFAHHATAVSARWSFDLLRWALMVIAMMLPGIAPMSRRLAFDSLWRRRNLNVAIYSSAYVAAWIGVGAVAALAVISAEAAVDGMFDPGRPMIAATITLAALWQFAPRRQRSLLRCHLPATISPRGWRATRGLVGYGFSSGRSCIGACGAVMAAMFVAGHDLHLMVPLAAVTLVDRFQRRPRPVVGASALAVTALLALVG